MKIRAKESCGAVSDLTKKLAGLGGKGEDLANVERDLIRLLNLHLATWLALYDIYIYIYHKSSEYVIFVYHHQLILVHCRLV